MPMMQKPFDYQDVGGGLLHDGKMGMRWSHALMHLVMIGKNFHNEFKQLL